LSRGLASQPTPPTGRAPGPGIAGTPETQQRADDVYSFLSSFTAGVRRGLEANSGQQPDPGGDDPR
jgi:hypothetical protein